MFKLIPLIFCFTSFASFANQGPVDLSTPLVENVVGHYDGSLSPDQISVEIYFGHPEYCRGGDCSTDTSTFRCEFTLSSLPLRDETGTLNTDLPFFLSNDQRLLGVFADQRSDCDRVVEQWKAQLPSVIHYNVDLIERTWIDWDTYANPAICRRNHVFYRRMEVEQLSPSRDSGSFKTTEDLLDYSVCDKLFNLSH